jgi:hypothetical protein
MQSLIQENNRLKEENLHLKNLIVKLLEEKYLLGGEHKIPNTKVVKKSNFHKKRRISKEKLDKELDEIQYCIRKNIPFKDFFKN